jgi:hypothetical protein
VPTSLGTRGKPRAMQSGGKPPHSKMGSAWMRGGRARTIKSWAAQNQRRPAEAGRYKVKYNCEGKEPAGRLRYERRTRSVGRFTKSKAALLGAEGVHYVNAGGAGCWQHRGYYRGGQQHCGAGDYWDDVWHAHVYYVTVG